MLMSLDCAIIDNDNHCMHAHVVEKSSNSASIRRRQAATKKLAENAQKHGNCKDGKKQAMASKE